MQPTRPPDAILVPWVLVTCVLPVFLTLNIAGAFTSHRSSWENASTTFFLAPLLSSYIRCLFLQTTMVLLREPKGPLPAILNAPPSHLRKGQLSSHNCSDQSPWSLLGFSLCLSLSSSLLAPTFTPVDPFAVPSTCQTTLYCASGHLHLCLPLPQKNFPSDGPTTATIIANAYILLIMPEHGSKQFMYEMLILTQPYERGLYYSLRWCGNRGTENLGALPKKGGLGIGGPGIGTQAAWLQSPRM